MTFQGSTDVLTFNLNNPSKERAERQLAYLADRPEPLLVLTETADSAGCDLLETQFRTAGYGVVFPRPVRGERGVMIVSRLAAVRGPACVTYLPHRAVSVTVQTDKGPSTSPASTFPPGTPPRPRRPASGNSSTTAAPAYRRAPADTAW
ncbi:hypothetical protein ABZ208_27700 [Streptomyces sp. NPDC006208]|uniref:hypothetical protein n=1 Tax=Streptomyces sp. NPDC006208 TaxID=3156734 RepID=UPI0033A29196